MGRKEGKEKRRDDTREKRVMEQVEYEREGWKKSREEEGRKVGER